MAVSKTVKKDNSNMVQIEPDGYIGLLSSVIHVGSQNTEYEGSQSVKDQVLLQFELQDVLTEAGKPITISKVVTNSLKDKASFVKIAAALGANTEEGVGLEQLIGKPVLVDMGYNKAKTKVVPKDFTKLPSALRSAVKPLVTTPKLLLDVDEITEAQKAELSEWIRKLIDSRIKSVHESEGNGDSVEL